MKRGLILIIIGVMLFSINLASALDACCEVTNDGDWCVYTDEDNCAADSLTTYTACEQTSYCSIGTCYTSDTGNCYENTPRSTCESERGNTWTTDPIEDVAQCQRGCCILADQASFVTEVKCKSIGSQYEDVEVDFDSSIESEYECLASVKNQDEGCCVDGDTYEFTTRGECNVDTPEVSTNFTQEGFHAGILCSNDLLSSDCAKQQTTTCYEGDVYWMDSCGNRENIYSSDDRESYNNGYVLDELDSCVVDGANDPDCGNCEYSLGNLCGEDYEGVMEVGNNACVDLNCENTFENDASPLSGQDRLNGESWCVYDNRVGEGADTVGSRHYRHICIQGEEVVESCTDFREEICISGVLTEEAFGNLDALQLSQSDVYVEAACRENRFECGVCNSEDEGLTERYDCCTNEDVRDCYWLDAAVSCDKDTDCGLGSVCTGGECLSEEDRQGEGVCVPQVPPGLEFWSDDGDTESTTTSEVCSVASTECTVTYRLGGVKRLLTGGTKRSESGDWDIVAESPDGCASREWAVQQNNYCRTLGDCGAHYNFAGEAGLDGFTSTLFDEDFFFSYDELETGDLGNWDYYASVDNIDEASDIGGFSSAQWYRNPATWIGVASVIVGRSSGVRGCKAQETADNAVDYADQYAKADAKIQTELIAAEKELDRLILITKDPNDPNDPHYSEFSAYIKITEDLRKERENNLNEYKTGKSTKAPQVPYLAGGESDKVLGYLGTATSTKSTLEKVGESLGCFGKGGLPLLGLFKPQDYGVEISPRVGEFIETAETAQEINGLIQKAKTSGGVSKVAKGVTIAAAVYLAVEYGLDNETTITYDIGCDLWQAPKGGDNCELCNNGNTPCSEYKCRSLGASCDLVNPGTSNETCVALLVNDVNSPVIEPLEVVLNDDYSIIEFTEESNKGFEINEKIPAFTNVQIGLKTDEPAQCKYSSDPSVEFDDMVNYFGSNIYLYNHSLMFSLGDEVTDEEIMALTEGEFTIYSRCSDANGNANERDYLIRFTVDDTPDLTPPEVVFTSLTDNSYLPFGVNETGFSLYTNEPADCRWNTNDTSFEYMQGEMDCVDSGYQQSSVYYGTYQCATTLTGADNEINNYYFRCNDQSNNLNEDSYEFTLLQTENELEIVSISPDGKIFDTELTLEIETEGGADDGEAVCRFYPEDVGYDSMVTFAVSNDTLHTQVLQIIEGDYEYYFACRDVAGNEARNSTEFSIEIDTDGPSLERVYVYEVYSVLVIETDEEAVCEYSSNSFTFGEGSTMSNEDGLEHEASLDSVYYYVTCEDNYGNQGSYEIDLAAWV